MLKTLKLRKKSNFTKNVMMLSGGAVFAQILNLIFSPIITRIYSPEEYGIMILFTALLGSISAFSSLSYDSAIPIAENDKKAIDIVFLSISILSLIAIFLCIYLYFFGEITLALLNSDKLLKYAYLIPLSFFCSGLYNILNKWSIRKKLFHELTLTKYTQSITGNVTKVGLGLFSAGPLGLLLGTLFSQSAGIVTLAKPLISIEKKINIKDIIWSAKRYIKFPIISTPTLFFLSVSGQLPVVFISILYGPVHAGLYGLALSITFLPMTLIGRSIEDVFYGEAASIGKTNPEGIRKLANRLIKKTFLIGLVPMIILGITGPYIFSIIFGDNWYDSGVYSRLIIIYVFAHFIFQPISSIFFIFENQGKQLILNVLNLILVGIVFLCASIFSLDSFTSVFIFAVAKVIIEVLKYLLVINILKKEIKNL